MALTDDEIREALETCASEPVHTPGVTQPFACLMAIDAETNAITHVSENCQDILGYHPSSMLGKDLLELVGREIWHDLQNTLFQPDASETMQPVGEVTLNGRDLHFAACQYGPRLIVEWEPARLAAFEGSNALKTIGFLISKVESCKTEEDLFSTTVRLMRNLTGYDRIMIYRFDRDFNGEVLAEERKSRLESFLNLRFPHWDIPEQARAMMLKSPLRFISDVDQAPVPLIARDDDPQPLDISHAASRGVSPIHLQYLRNMGSQATLTLHIESDGALWGIISFHHSSPRVPAPDLRELLKQFRHVFSSKLRVLRQDARIGLIARVDALKDRFQAEIETVRGFEDFATSVLEILDADGLALTEDGGTRVFGTVPDEPLTKHVFNLPMDRNALMSFDNLEKEFPGFSKAFNGCAGALVCAFEPARRLGIFRKEQSREVNWAGNPEKTIENHEGRNRISPRGSFSTYLEVVRGFSAPWSDEALYFASRIWTLVNTIERQELAKAMTHQQKIMIDELNHRVRNILTLIRSVSEQSRRASAGSSQGYADALEDRVQSLAASHDLASAGLADAVSIEKLIRLEFEPYGSDPDRVQIAGQGASIRPEAAPIFTLVLHELVTNSVKYGALSDARGGVEVTLSEQDDGVELTWTESGGPAVVEPKTLGFGINLIQKAIPHELGGRAALSFAETGVRATFFLPSRVLGETLDVTQSPNTAAANASKTATEFQDVLSEATCLIVEDNFIIAEGLGAQLRDFGIGGVETVPSVEAALDFLADQMPTFAILDVNLGGGQTSLPLASNLSDAGVPFLFMSGYGDSAHFEGRFADVLKLTKPAKPDEVFSAISETLGATGDGRS